MCDEESVSPFKYVLFGFKRFLGEVLIQYKYILKKVRNNVEKADKC